MRRKEVGSHAPTSSEEVKGSEWRGGRTDGLCWWSLERKKKKQKATTKYCSITNTQAAQRVLY
jgi:hypothetical protein